MIKNILAVRNDRFGEFLLNIPAFRALKQSFPEARLSLVVSPACAELAGLVPYADDIIRWAQDRHSWREIFAFSRLLKKKKFGLCVIFNPSAEFNLISFLAGIPLRVGYDRKRAFLLNKKTPDLKHLGKKHEVEYNLELAALAGAKTDDLSLCLPLKGEDSRQAGLTVALHPWSSDPSKLWPIENFRALASRLAGLGRQVIIVGGKEEAQKSPVYFSGLGSGIVDLSGKTTLVELAALLKKCALLVSADSGPMHLACCVGTPVLALFRNDIAGKTARRWGPWGKGHAVIERSGLAQISAEEVLTKVKEMLAK
jgi:ADP-heptose:LPS heptosyltransferase